MLDAYFDESEDPDSGVFCLAGWVSVPSAWHHFSSAWLEMLQNAPRPIQRGFHMKDIAHRTGEFSGWSSDEIKTLLTNAVDIILDNRLNTTMHAFGCTIVKPQVFRSDVSSYELYQTCFEAVFREVFTAFPIQMGMNFVFDQKEKVMRQVEEHFDSVKRILEAELNGKLGDCLFQSDTDSPPLQAADFIAYERRKRTQDRVAGANRLRVCYQRMRDGRPHRFRCLDSRMIEVITLKGGHFDFADIPVDED